MAGESVEYDILNKLRGNEKTAYTAIKIIIIDRIDNHKTRIRIYILIYIGHRYPVTFKSCVNYLKTKYKSKIKFSYTYGIWYNLI